LVHELAVLFVELRTIAVDGHRVCFRVGVVELGPPARFVAISKVGLVRPGKRRFNLHLWQSEKLL